MMPMADLPAVTARNISKAFGSYVAIENINIEVARGRFISIVGPSGCGKSTLLNIIAGLTSPSQGNIEVFGEPLVGINRRASYMFQRDALLPWKTVLANIQFGLRLRGYSRERALDEARTWVQRVGLGDFGHYYPYQLSGGMRKRVAIAQSWIVEPDLVLMDEPFSALDIHTRLRMEQEILNLASSSKATVVFVTHDLEEAIALSDEIFLLSASPRTCLVGRYEVDLPKPRNLIDIKSDSGFHELYQKIWQDLRKEVLKANATAHS